MSIDGDYSFIFNTMRGETVTSMQRTNTGNTAPVLFSEYPLYNLKVMITSIVDFGADGPFKSGQTKKCPTESVL